MESIVSFGFRFAARGLAKMLCEKRSYFKKSVVANREQQQKQAVADELDPFAESPATPSPTYLTYDPDC